jgi:hypothetical protein
MPLLDGREVTIYPLLFGAARLCVGPLADEYGYDIAYLYDSLRDASIAAENWDPEVSEHPDDYVKIEKGDDVVQDQVPQPGQQVKVRVDRDDFSIARKEHGDNIVTVHRRLKNGAKIAFSGAEKRDVDNRLFCEVNEVAVDNSELWVPPGEVKPDGTPIERLTLLFGDPEKEKKD